MKTIFILIAVAVLGLVGCSKHNSPTQSSGTRETSLANATKGSGRFLYNLYEQGKLPGLPKTDHGELKTKVLGLPETVQFPFSQTYQLERNSGFIYNCKVEKSSMSSSWRLIKAWETDAVGNAVKEFPIER